MKDDTASDIVDAAIRESQREDRIVWISEDLGGHVHYALLGECEDYAESNDGVVEYWGADDNGTWRIHVAA